MGLTSLHKYILDRNQWLSDTSFEIIDQNIIKYFEKMTTGDREPT